MLLELLAFLIKQIPMWSLHSYSRVVHHAFVVAHTINWILGFKISMAGNFIRKDSITVENSL